jgi:hypothetical protein
MLVLLTLAMAWTSPDARPSHVRATEPSIAALITAGLSGSATFRHLVTALDGSDVIVYIQPKVARPELRAYLSHQIVARGDHRYLRIMIDTRGPESRVVSILAHELQHAVEVAATPDALDADSLGRALERSALPFRCAGVSYETRKALDVQSAVLEELKRAGR